MPEEFKPTPLTPEQEEKADIIAQELLENLNKNTKDQPK